MLTVPQAGTTEILSEGFVTSVVLRTVVRDAERVESDTTVGWLFPADCFLNSHCKTGAYRSRPERRLMDTARLLAPYILLSVIRGEGSV